MTSQFIVVLGDGGAGKSAYVMRLVGGSFEEEIDPTIGAHQSNGLRLKAEAPLLPHF